jgi:hypothetical protein
MKPKASNPEVQLQRRGKNKDVEVKAKSEDHILSYVLSRKLVACNYSFTYRVFFCPIWSNSGLFFQNLVKKTQNVREDHTATATATAVV